VPGAKRLSEAVLVVQKKLDCQLPQLLLSVRYHRLSNPANLARVDFLEVEGVAWNASGSTLKPSAVTMSERVATCRCSWTALRARISELHQRLLEQKIYIRKVLLSCASQKFQLFVNCSQGELIFGHEGSWRQDPAWFSVDQKGSGVG
jgi:hypothetical protein